LIVPYRPADCSQRTFTRGPRGARMNHDRDPAKLRHKQRSALRRGVRMSVATILPPSAAAFVDVRNGGRAMRVSWHADNDLFVFSMWRDGRCAATFQLDRLSAPELISALAASLALSAPQPWTVPTLAGERRRRWWHRHT
jgi:hypothetical protein